MKGAEKLKAEGHPAEDALTPFRVHGPRKRRPRLKKVLPVRRATAIAGFAVAATAFALQWFSLAAAYPINSADGPP